MYDTLFIHVNLATMRPDLDAEFGAIKNVALAVKNDRIAAIDPMDDLSTAKAKQVIDCENRWMTPGLIDCHTHLVFSGNRTHEFQMRLQGKSCEEIIRASGGIISTVKTTRAASKTDLFKSAQKRLSAMKSEGVTTVEIKSGYGLDLENEVKMLRTAAQLSSENVRVSRTFLGAHALPPEFDNDADSYIDLICEEMIPKIATNRLADAVDGFCETIGFTSAQIRQVFETAKQYDLPVKLHAEQFSNQGGAALASEFGALSADHLEYISDAGVKAMAKAGTVAVLLPGAFYFLSETQKPPVDKFRERGVAMALATDCNPGSSPLTSALLTLNMGCTLFGLTPEEALAGMSRVGAQALGLSTDIGTLEVGKCADFALWDIEHPVELCYWMGANPLHMRIFAGQAE